MSTVIGTTTKGATILTGDDRITPLTLSKYEVARIISERLGQIQGGEPLLITEEQRIIPVSSSFISDRAKNSYIVPAESLEGQEILSSERKAILIDGKRYIVITSSKNLAILEYNMLKIPFVIIRPRYISLDDPSKNVYERWNLVGESKFGEPGVPGELRYSPEQFII